MVELRVFTLVVFLAGIQISFQAPLRNREKAGREEAIKIALESTGELIPRPRMVEKIKSDLELIRYLDPNLGSKIHVGKWKPGQLYIKDISKEQLDQVQDSEFKPIKAISESTMERGTVLMIFAKSFHPEHLSKLLKLRFGFDSYPVPANEMGDEDEIPDQIVYNHPLSTYYFNPENGHDCQKGCLAQYAVSINVNENSSEDDLARTAWEQNYV